MTNIIKVPVSQTEIFHGGLIGLLRMAQSVGRNSEGGNGCADRGAVSHVNGAIGEKMTAKHLGIYWAGHVGTYNTVADVGRYYEVRTTDHAQGRLILHKDSVDYVPYILARIQLPEVHVVGWLWGHEGKQQQFWKSEWERPCYLAWPVRDIATLPGDADIEAYLRAHNAPDPFPASRR